MLAFEGLFSGPSIFKNVSESLSFNHGSHSSRQALSIQALDFCCTEFTTSAFGDEPRRVRLDRPLQLPCSEWICIVWNSTSQPTKKLSKGGVLRKRKTSSLALFDLSCVGNA
jgi:hypothetical protein